MHGPCSPLVTAKRAMLTVALAQCSLQHHQASSPAPLESNRLVVDLMEDTMAGAAIGELVDHEMALQTAFGLVQIASFAGETPQRQTQTQPVALGTALVVVPTRYEHFLDAAGWQPVSFHENSPVVLGGLAPVRLAGQGIKVGEPAYGGQPAVAVHAVEALDGIAPIRRCVCPRPHSGCPWSRVPVRPGPRCTTGSRCRNPRHRFRRRRCSRLCCKPDRWR